ncbi:unnamed protein product [Allacma fusca]|uniref:Uncharacterized protein n=1 Tax=Allacma fusca TaxID=39272 RepID=A0A8J2KUZ1_9HEXA|nr:unnamed protein product [Allacma fusca]
MTLKKRERFGEKMMVAGAMSGVGVLLLIRVPPKVKFNAQYYMDQVLRPLLEDGIAQLYGEDSANVFVHHNAARFDTARLTEQYAKDLQDMTEIPAKKPDVSLRDVFGFEFLTQTLQRTKDSTMNGVWKNLAYRTTELLKNVLKLLGPGNDASVPYQKKMGNT